MASNYPGSLDSFDTIASDKKTSDAVGGRTHRAMHNDLGDAIEAIETELGTDPSGGSATVKARFEVIEANDWVTAARIAADAVGSSEIAADAVGSSELADSAVDTAAIADGAVTPVKMATSGRFTFPTGAANGYGFTSGAVHLSGTGTPEGVVTAAPGSTWLQTDSTTDVKGWIRWVKATGTGNTGWQVGADADTGWRDVTASLINGWAEVSLPLILRRVGDEVTLQASYALDGTAKTSDIFITAPAGFRQKTAGSLNVGWLQDWTRSGSAGLAPARFTDNSSISLDVGSNYSALHGVMRWATNDAWPASLPGLAA